MAKTEIRTVATALRAATSADFKLEGTACSYNSLSKDLGGFVERIAPGAFARSLANKSQDVICTFNHSPDKVLGRLKNGTLKLQDSPYSLDFSCQLDPKNTEHTNLYASVKRGDISECSFAFAIDNDGGRGEEFETVCTASGTTTLRTVTAAHLFDVSAVTNPAYGNGATNVNARQFRSCDYAAARQTVRFVQHILQTPKQIDLENQKRLLAIGTMICRDPFSNALIEDFELRTKAEKLAGVIERDELAEKFAELRRELGVE
jgi:HK97 family phage prohead protease